jgi:hypothetical protein
VSNAADFFTQTLAANPEAGKATFDDSPLPEGVYPLVVESCEMRKYVDGVKRTPEAIAEACGGDPTLVPGVEIAVTYVVTEGKFAKRKLFGSYCIQASSNQKSYGDFTPDKKVSSGKNDLCGLMIRLGKPNEWSDWVGKLFNGYVTAKKGKDGKIRNDLRCTVKPGEENAPKPSAPQNTTPHASEDAPF